MYTWIRFPAETLNEFSLIWLDDSEVEIILYHA